MERKTLVVFCALVLAGLSCGEKKKKKKRDGGTVTNTQTGTNGNAFPGGSACQTAGFFNAPNPAGNHPQSVKQILTQLQCVTCHTQGQAGFTSADLSTDQKIIAAASLVASSIERNSMPPQAKQNPNFVTQALKQTVSSWAAIQPTPPNTAADCGGLPSGTNTNFQTNTNTNVVQQPPTNGEPFGGTEDIAFSTSLWKAMESAGLLAESAGGEFRNGTNSPHGSLVRIGRYKVTVTHNNQTRQPATLWMKKNYDANKNLGAYTVMYQREGGYDSENRDWFWAKFLKADAQGNPVLDVNSAQKKLAGRVAKGAPPGQGCINCHRSAGGNDFVYDND